MGILRNIVLTVGLLWAVLFRICPVVAGTVFSAQGLTPTTVKQDTHHAISSTDSAVFLIQDEDERAVASPNPDFVPTLPTEWLSLLLLILAQQPIQRFLLRKPAGTHPPYYLLYCSLRIPAV
ncbi:hypothetical protein GCM10027347_41690 [Larkinella harenae]